MTNESKTLLDAVTSTGEGESFWQLKKDKTFQAILSVSTTPTATVDIEVSNDGNNWVVIGTITLSGSGDRDGFASSAAWLHHRGNVKAISGTSATVTLIAGY